MKKYAMMLMNPLFQPEEHTALFQTGDIENHILTVRNEEEAMCKTRELLDEGFGVLEVCGAFERELVEKMRNLVQGKICIGSVVYPPKEEAAAERYWLSER